MGLLTVIKKYRVSITSVLVFILFWEIGSRFNFLPRDYIGMPSGIAFQFMHLFTAETVGSYLLPSLEAVLIGLGLSIIIGVSLGFIIGVSPLLRKTFKPFLFALNAIPAVVFFPLIIIGLGISLQSVVLAIVMMCFVPLTINVIEGASRTDPRLLVMAKSFGASKFFSLREVTFYSTLPYVFAGIKTAIGKSSIALIVAEIFGLSSGIGYLVSYYGSTFKADKLMSVILLVLIFNGILFSILWILENSFVKYNYRKELS